MYEKRIMGSVIMCATLLVGAIYHKNTQKDKENIKPISDKTVQVIPAFDNNKVKHKCPHCGRDITE